MEKTDHSDESLSKWTSRPDEGTPQKQAHRQAKILYRLAETENDRWKGVRELLAHYKSRSDADPPEYETFLFDESLNELWTTNARSFLNRKLVFETESFESNETADFNQYKLFRTALEMAAQKPKLGRNPTPGCEALIWPDPIRVRIETKESAEHERTRELFIEKLEKCEDLISSRSGDIIEKIELESNAIQRKLEEQVLELQNSLARFLPHIRVFKTAFYFTSFFLTSIFVDLLLDVKIVQPFWAALGATISFGFIVMAYFMFRDWHDQSEP
jgi:hypothetical protein